MLICNFCGQDKEKVDSCIEIPIKINGVIYHAIRYGYETRYANEDREYERFPERCPDCGVKIGNYHHVGCSLEQCPICDLPINACGCITEVWAE